MSVLTFGPTLCRRVGPELVNHLFALRSLREERPVPYPPAVLLPLPSDERVFEKDNEATDVQVEQPADAGDDHYTPASQFR